jgi:lipid-binding SYLF domain-containing protein
VPTVTDSFSGTLTPNSGRTHTFITARSGSVTATLVSLGPDSGLTVGLSLGTWNGNACQIVLRKDNAVQTSSIVGAASAAGNLCVSIYDVGNLTDAVDYQIDVVHP